MRIALVTLATPEISPVARLSHPNRASYCRRHGHAFISHDRNPDAGRHPYWGKVPVLLSHLNDGFDWLFWSDADSLILNPDLRLEDLVAEDPAAELICTRDRHGINSGEFLISNKSGRAAAFLRAWYGQGQFVAHPRLPDQAAMTHAVDVGAAPIAVRYVPKRRLNAGLHDYQPGDFLLHFYGQPGRVFLMRKYLRTGGSDGVAEWRSDGVEEKAAGHSHSNTPSLQHSNTAALQRAHHHLAAGRADEAESLCREALAAAPADARAMHLLGLTLVELHAGPGQHGGRRLDEGLDWLCRSVELCPREPDFHNNLGAILYLHCGLRDDAADCFRTALRLRPDFPAARDNLDALATAVTGAPA